MNIRNKHVSVGFTLIEVMVVVVILGILAAIVVPRIMDRPDAARVTKAKQDIRTLQSSLNLYRLDNFVYPTTDQGLESLAEKPTTPPEPRNWKEGGYVDRLPSDPWQQPYQYLIPGTLVPETLAVPFKPGTWFVLKEATDATLRSGLQSGFAIDIENLETMLNPVYWKAQLPSFEDLKRRATEAVRKSADELLKQSKPTDETDNNPSPTTPSEPIPTAVPPTPVPGVPHCTDCTNREQLSPQGKLVTTSADILPITLPLYRGLPISQSWQRFDESVEQTNMLRWLMLMHVAKQPKVLEYSGTAAMLAAANLPSAQWSQYLFCGHTPDKCESFVKSHNNQPVLGIGSAKWKGKSMEEVGQSHQAFVKRYGPLLASQASALPQDIYVVAKATLVPILANTGGISFGSGQFLNPAGSSKDPNRLSKLPLAAFYSALVPNRRPETLPCSASRCTEILDAARVQGSSHDTYSVYLLAKVRLTSVQSSSITPTNESQATILGDIEVYADKELTKKLLQFDSLAHRSASTPAPVADKPIGQRQNPPGSMDDFANAYFQHKKDGAWQESSVNADYLLADPRQRYASALRLCIFYPNKIKLVSNSGKEAVVACAGSSEQEIENNVFNAIMGFK